MTTHLLCLLLLLVQAPVDTTADPAATASESPSATDAAASEDTEGAEPDEKAASEETETEPEEPEVVADTGPGFIERVSDSGALGLLLRGGPFMWPILVMGIIALGVMIERYRSLKMLSTNSTELREKVLHMLSEDKVEDALKLCQSEQGPVPAILGAGLRKYLILNRMGRAPDDIEEKVVESMNDYSVHVVAALERHLPILATVSSVAPMLGFLGTVAGMITSFENIVAQMGETNIVEAAAGGISQALLTTCFGLIIGIPAFISYNYFSSVINRFVLEVEESATDLIEIVTLQMTLKSLK